MCRNSDLKTTIINILKEDGLKEQTARNIAYGTQRMNDLERATRLSKAPHYLSFEVWKDLYKGSHKVAKKKKDDEK